MTAGRRWLSLYGSALALVLVLLVALVVLLGGQPGPALAAALRDSLFTAGGLGQTLNRSTPLLLAGLAFALGHRAGLFNVGMDGQIYAGAIAATGIGLWLDDWVGSSALAAAWLLAAGAVGGALWALPAALLRVRWGVNEIFTTVMLNFVSLHLVEYLSTGPWNDPLAGEAITLPLPEAARLPLLLARGGAHVGVVLAAILAVVAWWLLYRTVPGYELRAAGSNPRAAAVAGVEVTRVHVQALCAGGALSGLAGAIEVLGVHHRLLLGLTPNYGILSILVAVLARSHPLALIPASLAFAVLVAGTDSLQRTVGVPASAVFILQGLAVLLMLSHEAVQERRGAAVT